MHFLIGLKATHRLADVMRDLKRASSEWVHVTVGVREFAWQDGYGAFTVCASQCDEVCAYIVRQEEHRRRRTFREEYWSCCAAAAWSLIRGLWIERFLHTCRCACAWLGEFRGLPLRYTPG